MDPFEDAFFKSKPIRLLSEHSLPRASSPKLNKPRMWKYYVLQHKVIGR